MHWKIESVGIIEWFIPAIIAYQLMHYDYHKLHYENFDDSVNLSNDSKKPINNKIKNKKLHNSYEGFLLNESKNKSHNLFDIKKINYKQIPTNIDIFTYSFPCQDISHQGKQLGFNKNANTRSGLLWEIERIFNDLKKHHIALPKYLLMENVKAIVNKQHNNTFQQWRKKLKSFGYETKTYILNATMFGGCQNRERVFELSVLKTHQIKSGFVFPEFETSNIKEPLSAIIDQNNIKFDKKYNQYELEETNVTKNNIHKYRLKNYTNFQSENYVYDINYSGPTLTASGAMSRIKLYFGKNKIRQISSLECMRYMGFSDSDYYKLINSGLINDNQIIFLCGNSISVHVLKAIFRSLKF